MSHQAFSPLDESHISTFLKNQDKSQLDTAQEPLVDPKISYEVYQWYQTFGKASPEILEILKQIGTKIPSL